VGIIPLAFLFPEPGCKKKQQCHQAQHYEGVDAQAEKTRLPR
jgi:hypothetical protein